MSQKPTPRIPKILFVCGTNSCRSQMAEGLLRSIGGDRVDVHSAGTSSGIVHPLSREVMREAGLDISAQTSKSLSDLPDLSFDLVITLCDNARSACFSPTLLDDISRKRLFGGLPTFLHWSLKDPAEADPGRQPALFREIRDRIRNHVDALLNDGYLDALSLERKRLQSFADMLDAGVLIHDEYRSIILVNQSFLEITGHTADQIIGHDIHEIFATGSLFDEHLAGGNASMELGDQRIFQIPYTDTKGVAKQLKITSEVMEIEPGKRGYVLGVHDQSEVNRLRFQLRNRSRFHGMVGICPAIQEVFATIEMVGGSDYPVLVTGESGTGKEMVAAAIHKESKRSKGPFVPVNCGALPESIVESELFGHVRGAFTGAIKDKKGRFELADGGTLFLDEVGELPTSIQVKLLRVLQEKQIERVGGEKQINVDLRIISATNQDLQDLIQRGLFREDLYYRLCVVPLALPPLRERREDIPYLVEHILENIRRESGKSLEHLDKRAMDRLVAHDWPGNIRELINALQYASIRCEDVSILSEHLPPEVARGKPALEGRPMPEAPIPNFLPKRRTKGLSRERVTQALASTGDNKVQAAKLLGVGRATLYRFLDREKL